MRILLAITAVVSSLLAAAPARATDLTQCLQEMSVGESLDLVGDLQCSNGEPAVYLLDNTTLHLNGFTIRGGNDSIVCRGRCTIVGPGVLDGEPVIGGYGIAMQKWADVKLVDVTIRHRASGIKGYERRVSGGNRVALTNVVIENCPEGAVSAAGLVANGLTVNNCGPNVNSGGAIQAERLYGSDISVSDNPAAGIVARIVWVKNLQVTGNAGVGLTARRVHLFQSAVSGNDAGGGGIDLETKAPPVLNDSTCGVSSDGNGGSWGVCTND